MRQLKAELWAKWRGLASEQSQSGQTVSAFCRDRGLRDSLFYDWKKRIREGEAVKFVEVRVKVQGSNHLLPLQDPEALGTAIKEFVARNSA